MSVYSKVRNDSTKAWYFDLMFRGQRYRRLGGTTKTEALRAQEKFRAKLLNGEFEIVQTVKNPTLEKFSEKFLVRRKEYPSHWRKLIFVKHLLRRFKKSTRLRA